MYLAYYSLTQILCDDATVFVKTNLYLIVYPQTHFELISVAVLKQAIFSTSQYYWSRIVLLTIRVHNDVICRAHVALSAGSDPYSPVSSCKQGQKYVIIMINDCGVKELF